MKYMPTKVFIEHCRETEAKLAQEEQIKNNRSLEESRRIDETRRAVQEITEGARLKRMKFSEFSSSVKKSLLAEAMYKLLDKSLGPIQQESTMNNAIKMNLVNSFINENGVDRILSDFKYKSVLLSEVSKVVTKYHKQIIECADKDNPDTFVIDPDLKDDFFEDLNMDDFDDVAASIRTRVTDAVDEFIQKNIEDKEELKEILQNSKEKISSVPEELKESFEQQTKAKISKLRNSRKINIFEAMVRSLSKGVVQRDDLKAQYMNEGKLDMDKIVESCNIMYTFLEALQTAKIANIDEEYIHNVLLDLGK